MEMEEWVHGLLQWGGFFNNNLCNKGYISIPICYDVQVRMSLLVHGGCYSVGYPPVVRFLYGSLIIPP